MKIRRFLALLLAALTFAMALAGAGLCEEAAASREDDAGGWENILLLGTDDRGASGGYGNADSMIVLSVNRAAGEAKLTSVMRDLWVRIPGVKGEHKLNAACRFGGPELAMKTLNACLGLDIRSYVLVNLRGMAEAVDLLGGVRLDVTEAERQALNRGLVDLSSRSGREKLQASGEQVLLNGNQAVAYARIRRIDSDYRRTERQRAVLAALARQLQRKDPIALVGAVTQAVRHAETNLDLPRLLALAQLGLSLDLTAVEQYRVPAAGTYRDGMLGDVWCIQADMDRNRELLRGFIYG